MFKNLLIFAAGAAAGYLLREFILVRNGSQIVEKEEKVTEEKASKAEITIDELLAKREKTPVKASSYLKEEEVEAIIDPPSTRSSIQASAMPIVVPAIEITDKDEDRTRYAGYFPSPEEILEKQKIGVEVKTVEAYLIDENDFKDFMHNYDKTTILYDRELEEFSFEEDGGVIEDIVSLIGREAYEMLEDIDHTIYARNDRIETDFEVISIGG